MRSNLDKVSDSIIEQIGDHFKTRKNLSKRGYEQIVYSAFRKVFGDDWVEMWKKAQRERKQKEAKKSSEEKGEWDTAKVSDKTRVTFYVKKTGEPLKKESFLADLEKETETE